MTLRRVALAVVTGFATLTYCGLASALGLGEIKLNSALNEPLDAEIPLVGAGELSDTEIIVTLASQADFDRAGVEREFFLVDLQFKVDTTGADGAVVRVTSRKAVKEPYLDFLVNLRWSGGQLLREYTMLLDPPVFAGSKSAVGARPRVAGSSAGRPTQRPSPLSPDNSAAGETEYAVVQGDTLWEIASKVTPANATVQQTMLAIQALNPRAFINGNINLLVSGQVLRLPDADSIGAVDQSLAVGQVAEQTRAWQRLTTVPAAPIDARPAVDAVAAGTAGTNDQLRLSAPPSAAEVPEGTGGSGQSDSNQLATAREELERVTRENNELKQKLANLEEQLQVSARLAEITSDPARAAQLAAQADGDMGVVQDTTSSTTAPTQPHPSAEQARPSPLAPPDHPADQVTEAAPPASGSPKDAQTPDSLPLSPDAHTPVASLPQAADSTPTITEAGAAQPTPAAPPATATAAVVTPVTDTPATEPPDAEAAAEEGLLASLRRNQTVVLGLVGAVVLAVILLALRKRGTVEDEKTELPRFGGASAAPVGVHPVTPVKAPPSADDIKLDEDDMLFAPGPAPSTAVAEPFAAGAEELPAADEAERRLAALSEELSEERRSATTAESLLEPETRWTDLDKAPLSAGSTSTAQVAADPDFDLDSLHLDETPETLTGTPAGAGAISPDEFDIDALLDADATTAAPVRHAPGDNADFDLDT